MARIQHAGLLYFLRLPLDVTFRCTSSSLSELGVKRPQLLGYWNGSLMGKLRGASSMTDQLWPHHQALCQHFSQRPLIESQCHRWHYWLDRLAWRGLELLACTSLTTWPTQGDLLLFQTVSQDDRNLPAYLTTLGFLISHIMLLGFSIDPMLYALIATARHDVLDGQSMFPSPLG